MLDQSGGSHGPFKQLDLENRVDFGLNRKIKFIRNMSHLVCDLERSVESCC